MDILYETMVSSDGATALVVAGFFIMACAIGVTVAFINADEEKYAAVSALIAVFGIAMMVFSSSLPTNRRIYVLPEEGFCYIDYADEYKLVEQKGKILIMDKK